MKIYSVLLTLLAVSASFAPSAAKANEGPSSWEWVPVKEAVCGNGKSTGFGFRQTPGSDTLVLLFQGGGACRSFTECHILHLAARIADGYDAQTFEQEKTFLANDFFITTDGGPFSQMHLAWFPYCTGDLHAGRNVVHEIGSLETHHVGALNVEKYLSNISERLPHIKKVWLVGFSAGGFGALLNWRAAERAFPRARLNVIDDSGLAFARSSNVPERWGAELFPVDCQGCQTNMAKLFPYLAQRYPTSRFAFVSYTRDTVLPLFFLRSEADFREEAQTFANEVDASGLKNLAYYYVLGRGHVVSKRPEVSVKSVSYPQWLNDIVQGDVSLETERATGDDDIPEIAPAAPATSVLDPRDEAYTPAP